MSSTGAIAIDFRMSGRTPHGIIVDQTLIDAATLRLFFRHLLMGRRSFPRLS